MRPLLSTFTSITSITSIKFITASLAKMPMFLKFNNKTICRGTEVGKFTNRPKCKQVHELRWYNGSS